MQLPPWGMLAAVMAGIAMAGCSGGDAPPQAAAQAPLAPLSEAARQKQALEKLPLQLTSPLSPSFVPVLVRSAAASPETLPAAASQTLCRKAVESKRDKATDVHGYCIEAHRDGRRIAQQVF